MKVYYYLPILLLISCVASINNNDNNSLQEKNLKNEVSSVRTLSFFANNEFGVIQKGEQVFYNIFYENELLLFDKKGNIIEKEIYNKLGKVRKREIFIYDESKRLIFQKDFNENNKQTQDDYLKVIVHIL